jgi:hypothetical protein
MSDNALMDAVTREGVLVSASVRYPRFTKRLKPEDLGLESDDVNERLISLGHKKLLPRDALAGLALVESRVHALVERSSFAFLGGLARFLPNSKLDDVQQGLEGLKEEFEAARQKFLDEYAGHRIEALAEWEQSASQLAADPVTFMAAIRGAFPDAIEVGAKFGFDVHLFQVRAPERVTAQLVKFVDQQQFIQARNKAARDAALQMKASVETFVRDAVATMREQTATLCQEMLGAMQDGKMGVHQKTLNRLVNFIDEFKKLNFAGDGEMERLLDEARTQLLSKTAEEYRDDKLARVRLQDGIRQLADAAMNLAKEDTSELVGRFGQLGVRKFQLAA